MVCFEKNHSKSAYEQLTKCDVAPPLTKEFGRPRFLKKNKIFMWLIEQNAILTKDNLIRRNWQGSEECYMCGDPGDINHLFFRCPVAKVVWGLIAMCLHQHNRPNNYSQFWPWISSALPGGNVVYMLGLAVVC
jgi:hypothetical protein